MAHFYGAFFSFCNLLKTNALKIIFTKMQFFFGSSESRSMFVQSKQTTSEKKAYIYK